MEFFGKRQKRLCQEADRGDVERKLAGLGPEGVAGGADDVANIEGLEIGERRFTDGVFLYVELEPPLAVLHLDKGGLAEGAAGDDPPGHHKGPVVLRDVFQMGVGVRHVFRCMERPEIVRIGVDPRFP